MSVQIKTMAMKAKLANSLRKRFHDVSVKTRGFYKITKDTIPNVDKIIMFDKIWDEVYEMHRELRSYKLKRKEKKHIHEARVKRGYNFRKKVSKEEYLKKAS